MTMLLRLVSLVCVLAFVQGFGTPDLEVGKGTLSNIYGVAVDSVNQVLYVTDYSSHRILIWHDISSLNDGSQPDTVFGQPDLKSTTPGVGRNRLTFPQGAFVDEQGTLWVADTSNCRVLYWKNAHSLGNGANATGVIGQQDFVSASCGTGFSRMTNPSGVWVQQGSLYVNDGRQLRILRFDGVYQDDFPTVGATGSAVYGQPNETTTVKYGASESNWGDALFSCLDEHGMYVADDAYNRVLFFPSSELEKKTGAKASFVLGQPTFNDTKANNPSRSASSLSLAFSCFGTGEYLFVSDYSNSRVLMFEEPITTNQQEAVAVYGPSNFTTKDDSPLVAPFPIWLDAFGAVWVGDYGSKSIKRFSQVLAPSTDFSTDLVNIKLGTATPKASLSVGGSDPTLAISFVSFEEVTSGGSVVQTIEIPKGGYLVSPSASSTSNSITYSIQLSNGANASSTFSAFNSSDSLDFAGVAFSVKAGTIKFDFSLSGWDWQSASNTLNATIRLTSSNDTVISSPSTSSGVTTFTLDLSDEAKTTFTLQLINSGLVDGAAEEIEFSVNQIDAFTFDLVISVPHFSSTFEYDPQVSVENQQTSYSSSASSHASWVSLLSVLAAAFV